MDVLARGKKRTCQSCGGRFYDLNRAPAPCPYCGTENAVDTPRLKRARSTPEETRKPVEKKKIPVIVDDDAAIDVEDEDVDTEDDDDLLADTDIDDEDEDVTGVIGEIDSEEREP